MIIQNPISTRDFRKVLRASPTASEALLWKCLRGRRCCGFKFRRQHGVGPFILDFYCPEIQLAIELDGSVHEDLLRADYDEGRDAFLAGHGIQVLHLRNEAMLGDPEACMVYIKDEILRRASEPKIPAVGSLHRF